MFGEYRNTKERFPEGMRKLSGEDNIYLYGNGEYAREMIGILDKFHIAVKGVLVSGGYDAEAEFCSRAVYKAEEFFYGLKDAVVIVAGFNVLVHKQLTEKLVADSRVKSIYVLNGCQTVWNNGFRFPDPKVFLVDNYYEGLIKRDLNYKYFQENYELFRQTYDWLEDEKSKKTMEDYLRGHIELTNFPMTEVWETEDVEKQYFPEDVVRLSDREVFVDCGAYTGDTFESFCKRVGGFKKYYAMEPDQTLFEEVRSKITAGNAVHIPIGAWDEKGTLDMVVENGCGSIRDLGGADGQRIDTDKIDNLIGDEEQATFIKMDIEGAELKALKGAAGTIKRDKPKLAVCVYHKREDLITIPQYIKSLAGGYQLYLRAHFPYASEVVLYAVQK